MRSLGIDSLRFFTGDGKEILMKKQYSVTWEIIPADQVYSAFIRNPRGHFELFPDNNLNEKFDDGTSSGGKKTTSRIQIQTGKIYSVRVSNLNEQTIKFYRTAGATSEITIHNYDQSSEANGYKVEYNTGGYYTVEFTYSFANNLNCTYFTVTADVNDSKCIIKEISNELNIVVDEPGQIHLNNDGNEYFHEIYLKDADHHYLYDLTKTGENDDVYTEIEGSDYYRLDDVYDIIFFSYKYTKDADNYQGETVDYSNNKVLITVFDGYETVSQDYDIIDLFRMNQSIDRSTFEGLIQQNTFNVPEDFLDELSEQDYINNNSQYGITSDIFSQTLVTETSFDDIMEDDAFARIQTAPLYLMKYNIPAEQFPYVKYVGSYYMDKVSVDFIASQTIIVVSENTDSETGQTVYRYPNIQDSDNQETFRMHFHFQDNSEMQFITTEDKLNISKKSSIYTMTADEMEDYGDGSPMFFTIGFEAKEEGCYENIMGIFIRNIETDEEFIIGAIQFFVEAEGEDERFRTVLGNYGIPDPIKFPNIFKSQDPHEQGIDWRIVNKKSKELFLYYDEIFPYVGTYKALFNAIRYLGYQDLIFKEWYSIKDTNDNTKYVAIQNYETSTGNPIKNTLKNYGIDYEQYERYRKLNRLSMIYHMQRISEESEEQLPFVYENNGREVTQSNNSSSGYYDANDIPSVHNVYDYRTDEVIAKLYSVKQWLERYILGVNCYISDINGEGIVLERIKTVGYTTAHEFRDIQNTGVFTPNVKQVTPFMDSSAILQCSLNEFAHTVYPQSEIDRMDESDPRQLKKYCSVTFEDYKDMSIEQFIRYDSSHNVNVSGESVTVYESAPLGALTVADEYQFTLDLNNASTGSLYEFASVDSSINPIVVNDGEIIFWDDSFRISEIDSGELPIIQIKKGNLRRINGEWSSDNNPVGNIVWSVKPITVMQTSLEEQMYEGNSYVQFTYFPDNAMGEKKVIKAKSYITLSPDYINSVPQFIYSQNNKWNLPLFIIKGYKPTNLNSDEDTASFNTMDEYVLEILSGTIKFRNREQNSQPKYCIGAEIEFNDPNREDYGEQEISVNYKYKSERTRIYTYTPVSGTKRDFTELFDAVNANVTINDKIDIPVNRLGNYTVTVNAYDAWNNIFTNKSDDICPVKTKRASIDIILNQDHSRNSDDFFIGNVDHHSINDMSTDEIDEILSMTDSSALFPQNYKIYNAEHIIDDNTITYNNISYAIDTPKANDYMILTNMTEAVENISFDTTTTLTMNANNPNKQEIYVNFGQVSLCLYDDNLQSILYETEDPIKIKSYNRTNHKIVLDSPLTALRPYENIINDVTNNVTLYVINASREMIDSSTTIVNDISIDSSGNVQRRCYVYLNPQSKTGGSGNDYQLFPSDSMIKFCIEGNNGDKRIFHNETAYRVLDYVNTTNDNNQFVCYYELDGNIDTEYIKSLHNINVYKYADSDAQDSSMYVHPDLSMYITPVHTDPVKYTLRVNSDAAENIFIYGNYEYYTMNTTVNYNQRQLMFNSYFDDTYSATIAKFDPVSLKDIWEDIQSIDASLWKYTDYPVTIGQNRRVIVVPNIPYPDGYDKDTGKTLIEDNVYKTLWKWKTYGIEDNTNWKERQSNYEKLLLFESKNKILTVRPNTLGSQSIELYCMDKYGNVIKNTGGGNIFITE